MCASERLAPFIHYSEDRALLLTYTGGLLSLRSPRTPTTSRDQRLLGFAPLLEYLQIIAASARLDSVYHLELMNFGILGINSAP